MLAAMFLLGWPTQQATAPDLIGFRNRAEMALMAGEALPADYRQQLLRMPPAERIEAIIYLRRIGLLTGRAWRVDDLLRPAPDEEREAE